jgi:hypothetical protein
MTLTVVDTEAVVRDWARAEANIHGAVVDEIWYSTPQKYASDTAPNGLSTLAPKSWVVLSLISDVHEPSDIGMQQSLIQFTCYGRTKLLAAKAAVAVQQAGRGLQWGPPVTVDAAVIQSGSVSQRRWFPDRVTNLPRYVVDLLFLIRGTATA